MFDPWDYPPEFSFSGPEARYWDLISIWDAVGDPVKCKAVRKRWEAEVRRFPGWVVERWYITRVYGNKLPGYLEDWDDAIEECRADWRDLYADELSDANGLVTILAQGVAAVYRAARLSNREIDAMKAYMATGDLSPTSIGDALGIDRGAANQLIQRALAKLSSEFVHAPALTN